METNKKLKFEPGTHFDWWVELGEQSAYKIKGQEPVIPNAELAILTLLHSQIINEKVCGEALYISEKRVKELEEEIKRKDSLIEESYYSGYNRGSSFDLFKKENNI